MVKVVKSEWHQVEKVYGCDIDANIIKEIYPDLSKKDIKKLLTDIEKGNKDIDDVLNDAWENDVEIEWDYLNQDDWWTDRKGGYEISYKIQDWKYHEEYQPPKTHKCTKCRWIGTKYDAHTLYLNEDGTVHTDDDLEFNHTKEICPMCDSDVELTPEGVIEEEKNNQRKKEIEKLLNEIDNTEEK